MPIHMWNTPGAREVALAFNLLLARVLRSSKRRTRSVFAREEDPVEETPVDQTAVDQTAAAPEPGPVGRPQFMEPHAP
jgi:hypothetical protein